MSPQLLERGPVIDRLIDIPETAQHALDVAIHQRLVLVEGQAQNRARGIVADARQRQQSLALLRQPAGMLQGYNLRGLVQIARPRIVTQPFPQLQDGLLIGSGQRLDGRKDLQPPHIVIADGLDARLLGHDFADPDRVWIAHACRRGAPGQFALMATVPGNEARGQFDNVFRLLHGENR